MDAHDFMPDEAAIARIRSEIAAYEVRRRAQTSVIGWRLPVFLLVLLVGVLVVARLFNNFADANEQWASTPHVILYVLAAAGVAIGLLLFRRKSPDLQQPFRDRLLPIVFGFVKDIDYRLGQMPGSFDRLPRTATGDFTGRLFDDVISGTYQGFSFELYETTLTRRNAGVDETVFKGVIMSFQTVQPFPGQLIASNKTVKAQKLFRDFFRGSGLSELSSGVASLDAIYDFRTDNVSAAQPLVSGRLAQALQWLADTWPGEPARIALQNSDGFLLLPLHRDVFQLPDIATPLDYKAHIEPMVSDLAALLATVALVRQVGDTDKSAQP